MKTYFNVPTLCIKPLTKARAYAEAVRRWRVDIDENRQDDAGIIYSNGLREIAVNWADLPAPTRNSR